MASPTHSPHRVMIKIKRDNRYEKILKLKVQLQVIIMGEKAAVGNSAGKSVGWQAAGA